MKETSVLFPYLVLGAGNGLVSRVAAPVLALVFLLDLGLMLRM